MSPSLSVCQVISDTKKFHDSLPGCIPALADIAGSPVAMKRSD
mgnify:CR=1 FL=1